MGTIVHIYTMKLSERLARNLRYRRGDLTQAEFARKLGISRPTLTRLENADQNVTLETLNTITKKLKCDIGELFERPTY